MSEFAKFQFDKVPSGTFEASKEKERAGMLFSIQLGKSLQETYPTMAADYRSGSSIAEIIKKYDLIKHYSVTYETARMGVRYALTGYEGEITISREAKYRGLIESTEEQAKIANEHNVATGRKVGLDLRDAKKGLFALSPEMKSEIGRKSGKAQFEKGIGIHSQTIEERKKSGRALAESLGMTVFSDEEISFIKEKIDDPEYQRRTRINAKKLSDVLNDTFHGGSAIRTPRSIRKIVYRLKTGDRT